jgi:hypothetical protein
MGHAVRLVRQYLWLLGNWCRSGRQQVMDLLDFAADGTRQSEAGGQILEDAQWLRHDGRRLVDSPLIQCIVIGM